MKCCTCLLLIIQFSFSFNLLAQPPSTAPYVIILGTAQDGGYPQAGCRRECCAEFYSGRGEKHTVSSIAVVDPLTRERFLFDCTPDFAAQLHLLDSLFPSENGLNGILLTHAHIGHYTGLMHLGREAMNARMVNVWAMPDMKKFLEQNAPWKLLAELDNIRLNPLQADSPIQLNNRIRVTPFYVPHRHEFTLAVGYKIQWGGHSVIFIPDIDKWEKWNHSLLQLVKENDVLLLDGTFFRDGEIPGRNMNDIPHPFIEETMKLLEPLPATERSKVYFIHLNHTNPALRRNSEAQKEIEAAGFHVATEGLMIH
jgi:pyrroloquinoline quinone biosynthesis protein B